MKLVVFIIISFCAVLLSAQSDSASIKVHFYYGSRPKWNARKVEKKQFGGLHCGHVSLQIGDSVFSFRKRGKIHVFPHRKGYHSKWENLPLEIWMKDTAKAIAISAPTNVTDAFTAEYIRASPHNVFGTAHTAPLLNLDSCEYWQLDRTIGTSAVDVTIYGNANSGCGGSTGSNFFTGNGTILSNLIVAHWNSTLQSWENATAGATTVTGTTSALTVKAPSVNSFSPFIFGAVGNNPLPVKLISFKAKAIGRVINLTWVTASEINNDYFDIERSNDGLHFIKIGQIKGNGTTSNTSSYGYNDVLELEENTMIYYYRLKQVDYSGDYEYSMIRWVNIGLTFQPIIETVKPNPFNDILTVTYAYSEKGKATLEVVNLEGLLVFRKEASSVKGYNQFQVNTESLSKGVYYIRINVNGVDSKYGKVVKL